MQKIGISTCAPRSKEPLLPTVPEPYGSPYVMDILQHGLHIKSTTYENDKREVKKKKKKGKKAMVPFH
jgi:hypothetical protein